MIPNMNIGDLVVVVQKDRFGELQTWDDGKVSGYKKFGDYGDVIIYRPNGITDMWASVGLLPLSKQHPIIHRAMTWTEAGEPVPLYINIYRGSVTPTGYLPLTVVGHDRKRVHDPLDRYTEPCCKLHARCQGSRYAEHLRGTIISCPLIPLSRMPGMSEYQYHHRPRRVHHEG